MADIVYKYTMMSCCADPENPGFLVDILPPAQLQLTIYAEPEWRRNYFRLCREAARSETSPQQVSHTN